MPSSMASAIALDATNQRSIETQTRRTGTSTG